MWHSLFNHHITKTEPVRRTTPQIRPFNSTVFSPECLNEYFTTRCLKSLINSVLLSQQYAVAHVCKASDEEATVRTPSRLWKDLTLKNTRKVNWIGHILSTNCLLKHAIKGKTEERIKGTGRWRRRRNQLLDDTKEKKRTLKLKAEALDITLWRRGYGRGYGLVVTQIIQWMNEWIGGACVVTWSQELCWR
jgi:hypothetical protein